MVAFSHFLSKTHRAAPFSALPGGILIILSVKHHELSLSDFSSSSAILRNALSVPIQKT